MYWLPRLSNGYVFIYKTILGKIPTYFFNWNNGSHKLPTMDFLRFVFTKVWTELEKKRFGV